MSWRDGSCFVAGPDAGEEALGILAEIRQVDAADLGVDQVGRPTLAPRERLLEVVLRVDRITVAPQAWAKAT